jgi:hypothetical protein
LKSTTEEEAAIELLEQTKPKNILIRKALMQFISPIKPQLFRKYQKYAHLFDWIEVLVYFQDLSVNHMEIDQLESFALFMEIFKDYLPSYYVNHYLGDITSYLSKYLPKCNKYADTASGYAHAIQKCGCYFHPESVLNMVISSKK